MSHTREYYADKTCAHCHEPLLNEDGTFVGKGILRARHQYWHDKAPCNCAMVGPGERTTVAVETPVLVRTRFDGVVMGDA